MASNKMIRCPAHGLEIVSTRTIPLMKNGETVQEPIFYCERCGKYYIHTDLAAFGDRFDYGDKEVVNTDAEVYCRDTADILCCNPSKLKPYTAPFIPEVCVKDQEALQYTSHGVLQVRNDTVHISGYYCRKCGDFYIDEDEYDTIRYELGEHFSDSTEQPGKDGGLRQYGIEGLRPSTHRRTTAQVADKLLSFEDCEKNYETDYPFSLLHYAFVFRRFDAVSRMMEQLSPEQFEEALHFPGPEGFEWIKPIVCAKWNMSYIWSYDDRNASHIAQRLERYLDEVEHIDELIEYTESVDPDGNDVYTVFWNGNQPMLDVILYEKQKTASLQVRKNNFSLVMDEVGTGKTVSALYAIRDMIQTKAQSGEKARILVVCPYNKREDWQDDIRRQLGRFAHIVEQGDSGEMYRDHLKKVFFKRKEHIILIAGQRQGMDREGSHSALKGSLESYSSTEPWDLAVIDEAHLFFENYSGISANRLMLLTATPVVVNAKGKRTYGDYQALASKILNQPVTARIDPIDRPVPTAEDVYVNWFREDMEKSSAERNIRFVSCKRWVERDDIFYQIREKKGALAALQYDQDDEYLYRAAVDQYELQNVPEVRKNAKMDRLNALLHENGKSFIIFCEHQFVVDRIFQMLKDEFYDCVIAEKYGKHEDQHGLEHVQSGQLVNSLMQAVRDGRRVLFVTTGKTGGTGLNLGEFDGVIHYELPFTSMELEQRFGRVDRIDAPMSSHAKDMIFLLNECRPDENDLEINRMLYYCTTKIDVTCQFMPVRNTVLYYPEFIKRNGKAIRGSLRSLQEEYILSEENEKKVRGLLRNIRKMEKQIQEDPLWACIEQPQKSIRICALEALTRVRDERISEQYYRLLKEYLEYWKSTRPDRLNYGKMYRTFQESKRNACYWLAVIGLIRVEADSPIFVGIEQKENEDETSFALREDAPKGPAAKERATVQQQLAEVIGLIDQCVFEEEELRSFSTDGIFCFKDGRIRRSSVADYRGGYGWR